MKLKDAEMGKTVYLKKSYRLRLKRGKITPETPLKIKRIVRLKSGLATKIKVLIEQHGLHLNLYELTEIPCSRMSCENCIYHPKKEKNDTTSKSSAPRKKKATRRENV